MSRLRRWEKRECSLLIPALTRWAKVCRASGAGRNANALLIPALTRWAKVCRAYGAGRNANALLIPALTRWANLCRAYGAGRKANSPFSSQRLRAGLKYAAPPALEETQMFPSHPSAYALG